ncbi:MAG: polysaccharide deacetylase family protein, partial [Stenotrophomonas sp.]
MLRLRHLLVAFALCLASALQAQTLSLTFDDGLNPDAQPAAAQWNAQLLAQLEQAGITAMVFPARVRTGPGSGTGLIADWPAAGHAVGNHTSEHRSLAASTVSLADFIEQASQAQDHFGHLPGWQRMLRFPYLKEGNSVDKRDGMRAWLQANDYRAAPVSIDASDWYYDQVFSAWLAQGNSDKAKQVKQAYIAHLLQRAAYYDQLAQQLLGRRP